VEVVLEEIGGSDFLKVSFGYRDPLELGWDLGKKAESL